MSEFKEYSFFNGGDKMPEQRLLLFGRQVIEHDADTLDDGQPDWRGIQHRLGLPTPMVAIDLYYARQNSLEYILREAHRLGEAPAYRQKLHEVTEGIKQAKSDYEDWRKIQGQL